MKKLSKEHKEKLRQAKLGCHLSEEHKKHISNAQKGNGYSFIRGYSYDSNGYIVFNIGGEKIKEHRLVMEKYLGRPLKDDEHIHHKDGNPANNSIDNLEIINLSQHTSNHRRTKEPHKHHNIQWLKDQLKTKTQRSIATECGVSEAAIGSFISRYINYPNCKTWIEYYKIRELNRRKD